MIKIENLDLIQVEFDTVDENTLVFVDIGETLITPSDAVLCKESEPWVENWLKRKHRILSPPERLEMVVLLNTFNHHRLVDPQWPKAIKQAQAKGAKVLALTRLNHFDLEISLKGKYSRILNSFGIFMNEDLPIASGNSFIYGNGIIKTTGLKGVVVKEVLTQLNFNAKKIIFIDDNLHQINSVVQCCVEIGLNWLAFFYTPPKIDSIINEDIANLQMLYLIENRIWINDENARAILEGRISNE